MKDTNKEFYLMVNGQKVSVSEEVYRAYVRPIRAEQRAKRRGWKCRLIGENGQFKRCREDCSNCAYALSGGKTTGNVTSLDKLIVKGFDREDPSQDIEQMYIEQEEVQERNQKLYAAIKQLKPRQQEMVRMIYFEGMSQDEVARCFGIAKQSVSDAMRRIYASLKKFLEKI